MEGHKDLKINNILDLQLALLENNNSAIHGYVERLDRETSNAAMVQASEHFGFPWIEIEGVARTSLRHLASVFGYKAPRALKDLLERRGIYGVKIGGFEHNTQSIRNSLGLDLKDNSAILYDWPAFLIGGMNSTNEEAQKVQGYLLRMERVARIGIVGVKTGQPMPDLPDGVHMMCITKLVASAWKGNPIASYVLEHHYSIPVGQLMHRTDPRPLRARRPDRTIPPLRPGRQAHLARPPVQKCWSRNNHRGAYTCCLQHIPGCGQAAQAPQVLRQYVQPRQYPQPRGRCHGGPRLAPLHTPRPPQRLQYIPLRADNRRL